MPATPALTPLTLISGDEDLLVARAVDDVLAAVRAKDSEADVRLVDADALDGSALLDLATPSLFGDLRVLVVRITGALSDDVRDGLLALVESPDPSVVLVVVHPGGNVGKRLVDAVKAAGAKVVPCAKVDKKELPAFVLTELRRFGAQATESAARALVEAVGSDLRELSGACAQLATDTPGDVDDVAVARFFRGRADVNGFVVAERAVEGSVGAALVELRMALAGGLAPVLVVSALARQLRTVARVASAGRGSPDVIARDLKMAPWQVKKAQRQLRGWTPEALVAAHRAVAVADGEVKGGGTDPAYAAERAVLAVATACETR